MSRRRFQKGSVFQNKTKTVWIGAFSEYALNSHGAEVRNRKQIVLCPVRCGERVTGKREAMRLLQPHLDRVNTSLASPVSERKTATFEAFAEIWKRDYLSLSKPSTQAGFRSTLKRLTAQFGNREMRSIGAGDIQRMIASGTAAGLGAKSIRNLWATVSLIWNAALAQKYVDAMLPKPKLPRRPKIKAQFFRLQNVANIIAASKGEQKVFYWLAAETGLRSGEIAGLRLTDIDGESLKIEQSIWHGKEQEPKTDNAKRTLAVSPQLISLLWKQIARQKTKGHEYLFTSKNGTPWDMDNIRERMLHPLLDSLGIPMAGFHAFRRFNISLLDALRVPRLTIKKRSGHAFIGDFTMDVYGTEPEWDTDLEAARLAGAEIERAVGQVKTEPESTPEFVGIQHHGPIILAT